MLRSADRSRCLCHLHRLTMAATLAAPSLACAEGLRAPDAAPAASTWEGALGVIASVRPEYSGAAKQISKLTPALFVRYGRFSITNASGFVTRRADDVARGLGLNMLRSERLHVSLALRFDPGRNERSSAAFAGLGNIRRTVRARINVGWRLDHGWRAGIAWSADALGRGGGHFGDVSVAHEQRLLSATTLTLGSALTLAGDRYMQSYYGISEAQASRSGYPVYTPSAGVRDVALFANLRTELSPEWILLGGAGVSRLLGPAAASPLARSPGGWGLSLGIARRF